MRPIRLVAWESAVSRVSGSSWPGGRNSPVPMRAGPSARNSESNFALSASWASLIQWSRSKSARALLSGRRQDASWWPASIRKALRWSRRLRSLTVVLLRWCRVAGAGGSAELRTVVAGGQDAVGDRGDVDLRRDLPGRQEGVAELLLRGDVGRLDRGHPVLLGEQRGLGVRER